MGFLGWEQAWLAWRGGKKEMEGRKGHQRGESSEQGEKEKEARQNPWGYIFWIPASRARPLMCAV